MRSIRQPKVQVPPHIVHGGPKVSSCIAHCAVAQVALHAADQGRAGAWVSIVQLQEVPHDPVIEMDAKLHERGDPVIEALIFRSAGS